jgi:2'-5' RNA ligase
LSEKLRAAIRENVTHDFGSLRTSKFSLIESKLKPSGAEYTTLESFAFVAVEV